MHWFPEGQFCLWQGAVEAQLAAVCFCYPNGLGKLQGIQGAGLEMPDAIGGA